MRRGRHFGLEVHVLTSWSRTGSTVASGGQFRSVAASNRFGQMEARELYEIATTLGISPEERDRIERAGQGEGLLVTTSRRVWVNLYGHTSPGSFRHGQHRRPGRRRRRQEERISDIGVGSGGTSRGLVRSAFRCRILQGLAQSSDDRCDAARAHIAASAGARCPDRRHPHEVALD